MKGMKEFDNNYKNKTGNTNQHRLFELGFVLPIQKKQNLYQQNVHHCMAWLLKPWHTLIILLLHISSENYCHL